MSQAVNPSSALIRRRTLLSAAALPWLGACGSPLPLLPSPPQSDPQAAALLLDSARVHGLEAYRQINDINIAYTGQWRPFIDGIQPEVVDAGYRGASEERLMPRLGIRPGLGQIAGDRVALFIDRDDRITRRVRFTLEGTVSTAGAVAEVDRFEHQQRFGVLWPMRSYEEVRHPLRLPAHDWRIAGLDVNRGYGADALAGPELTGSAAAPAQAV